MNKPIPYRTSPATQHLSCPFDPLALNQRQLVMDSRVGEAHSLAGVRCGGVSFKAAASGFSFSDVELYLNRV